MQKSRILRRRNELWQISNKAHSCKISRYSIMHSEEIINPLQEAVIEQVVTNSAGCTYYMGISSK
jgi:hypothetical protein